MAFGYTEIWRKARQFVRGSCGCLCWLGRKRVLRLSLLTLMVVGIMYLSSELFQEHFETLTEPVKYLRFSRPHPNQPRIACRFPKLDPFSPQMMSMINQTVFRSQLNCSADLELAVFKGAAFHVENGHLLVRDVEFPEDVKCCLQEVTADGVEKVRIGKKCNDIENANHTTTIQFPIDTILITCKTSKNQIYYKDVFQLFHEKPEVEKRIKTWETREPNKMNDDGRLSVIIIGIDTTSQMQFERGMPLSKKFVDENLSGVRIMGYNKVGQNTYPNIIPLSSGMTQEEYFEQECVNISKVTDNHEFHECPLIWKSFASQGYRTSFGEVGISMFLNHVYRKAFTGTPPTDYHNGPFTISMQTILNTRHYGPCFGPRLSFKSVMDHAQSISDLFGDRRYFNFVWANALGHTLDRHQWADKHLLHLLQHLLEAGHLNNTALFLLGDHGYFYDEQAEQAYIESRMPLAYIVLPPWFPQRYSKAFQNLQWNAENSIASPFDMHKTILDMLDLERFLDEDVENWSENRHHFHPTNPTMRKKGQSLFEVNPDGRNCVSAGIPPFYCVCLPQIPLRNDSFLAVKAGQAAIDTINRKTEKISKCEKLQLGKILTASILASNEEMGRNQTPECLSIISNTNATMTVSCQEEFIVRVRFMAAPHEPIFQSLVVRSSTGEFSAPSEVELMRESLYFKLGHCVPQEFQPYCVCKDV